MLEGEAELVDVATVMLLLPVRVLRARRRQIFGCETTTWTGTVLLHA